MANARSKGIRGERLIIDWLQPLCDLVSKELNKQKVTLQRNTIQSDKGGSDVVGLDWLAIEVKNVEATTSGALEKWWEQCVEQARTWSRIDKPLTPILFYTRKRQPVRVRMFGHAGWSAPYIGVNLAGNIVHCGQACVVDISAEDFQLYFMQRLRIEFAKLP